MTNKIPTFIAITTRNIYHEGDQRSRDHPGHGYPAYTEEVPEINNYYDMESVKSDILKGKITDSTILYKVSPVKITKNVSIDISS